MALKLIANYSKRLGLPGYSSHQFSVCVETEIHNTDDIAGESQRLYETLQQSVDEEIQHTGFVPTDEYGKNGRANGHSNGRGASNSPQNGGTHGQNGNGAWQCSDKQRDLILKLIDEHNLDKSEVEDLARDMFNGKGVKQLNKLEASGLIDRLFEQVGEKPTRPQRQSRPAGYSGNGKGRQ
jgi:hypothetical protein